ncbi:hypothetical protein RvY_00405-1 [Ramazzottius varieornatus]|uniref:Uncharacterized protein n=2 Tax=Ramazzottius varieornatus TaxID=947166 RepID=A0A1D1UN40_RAMVA|nr:hypothetical protein RvY_00405-1 [Ramazzottius varieornatus]
MCLLDKLLPHLDNVSVTSLKLKKGLAAHRHTTRHNKPQHYFHLHQHHHHHPHHHKKKNPNDKVTARDWLESLVEKVDHPFTPAVETDPSLPPERYTAQDVKVSPCPKSKTSEVFGSTHNAEEVRNLVRKVLMHQFEMTSQHEIPNLHHHLLSLHMSKEPRKGAHLGALDRIRYMILKRRIVSMRKHSTVAVLRLHPNGLPALEELYAKTEEHVAENREKLFDVLESTESRQIAADAILDDLDLICPLKPSPHLKQISRLRDKRHLSLIGRSTINIPFESSDFMARWLYRRCLQTCELNGCQLTQIQEQRSQEEDLNLSKIGKYQCTKCVASKVVSARKSARYTDGPRNMANLTGSGYDLSRKYSVSQMPSMATIVEESESHVSHGPTLALYDSDSTMLNEEIFSHHQLPPKNNLFFRGPRMNISGDSQQSKRSSGLRTVPDGDQFEH